MSVSQQGVGMHLTRPLNTKRESNIYKLRVYCQFVNI